MQADTEPSIQEESTEHEPQLPAALERAFKLQDEGKMDAAMAELETALAEARETPDALDFRDRVTVALMLGDFYVDDGAVDKACDMLAAEVSHAEEVYLSIKQTGTMIEKREVLDGLTVIRDQRTQVSLIGQTAPEISVKDWINSEPLALASHRGKVVLLEFWATWCKPCHSMFPKIKKLHDEYVAEGLRVLGLTRYYFSFKATAGSEESEQELIRKFVLDNGLEFPVGIAEDARTQMLYGATGLPTFVLIDRRGAVRLYGRLGGDGTDPKFDAELRKCIEESEC